MSMTFLTRVETVLMAAVLSAPALPTDATQHSATDRAEFAGFVLGSSVEEAKRVIREDFRQSVSTSDADRFKSNVWAYHDKDAEEETDYKKRHGGLLRKTPPRYRTNKQYWKEEWLVYRGHPQLDQAQKTILRFKHGKLDEILVEFPWPNRSTDDDSEIPGDLLGEYRNAPPMASISGNSEYFDSLVAALEKRYGPFPETSNRWSPRKRIGKRATLKVYATMGSMLGPPSCICVSAQGAPLPKEKVTDFEGGF